MTKKRQKTPKNAKKIKCILCDFKCSKQSDYNRHLLTRKHQNNEKRMTLDDKKTPKNANNFECVCGKKYMYRQGLWNHHKRCNISSTNDTVSEIKQIDGLHKSDIKIDKDLVMSVLKQNGELMKENNDFKQMLMETQNHVVELLKKGTHNTTNNTNSHNKTFNLNFFLNETCKNAMNIMDFVNNLQLQLGDLEKMEDVGYVNGMSNIIIKNLKDMDVTERPVHCTDAKREVLYVKDEDKWDKETNDKPKIRKAIKHVAHKNARLLQEFKEKHPDCTKSESKYSDTYNKLIVEAMGGKGNNDDEQESKIIKKLSKEITLAEVNE